MARADAGGSRSGRHFHEAALKRQRTREQWSILSLVVPAMIVIVLIVLIPLS